MNLFRILSFATLAGFPAAVLAEIDFNRDIRPILSDHCYACHGPDAKERKGELRLDLKEAALGAGESGERTIVPGDLEKSELIRRVTSTDRDEMMPPKKATKRLNAAQISLLERWVKEGAKWTGHWAFEPLNPASPPEAQRVDSAIDAFVQARLLNEGLAIAPEEEKARLIRRVSLDLTGLPPEVKQVDAFLAGADSYETVVDRLLASPHFGERLALPWLDLARYGDTSGYHNDSLRDMWLWREWVVNAFNANMPFDQFTIEQLAGDLLPNPTLQQQVASGFHRNVMTSDEGGLIESEYLDIYVVDRVNTTGTVWLGLTVQCAECHDHKYDPITQRDYYGLYAFFHNVPESGKDGVRDRNPKPFLRVPTGEQQMKFAALDRDIAAAEQAALALVPKLDELQRAWEAQLLATGPGELPAPAAVFPLDDGPAGRDAAGNPIVALLHGEATFVDGAVSKSFRIEAKGHIDVGDHFGFEKDQPFSASAWLRLKPKTGAPFGKMEPGPVYRGWDLEIQDGKPTVHLIHKWPEEAIHVVANDPLPFDTFHHVAFTYDGSGKAAGVRIFVNGMEIKTKAERDNLTGSIVTKAPFRIGQRGDSNFTGRVDDLRIYARKLETGMVAQLGAEAQLAIVKIPEAERSASQKQTLQKFFRESQASEYQVAQKRIADLKKAREDLDKQVPNTMVMAELEKPRDTFIKLRGAYDQNGEKVSAAVPAFLPQVPPREDGKPLNRLDLARWLVSKEHPLTARVAVNRWWTMLFGTGLVKTGNDFGSQGEWPSHPELLDWLAADFARDWNIKRAIKQIVMSATYRQQARATTELVARDSENRLLARGPRQRLDAELLRDNALAIAGILNPQLGGRSIKPAQPPGTWEINEMSGYSYQKSSGADLYRRGLYVYWRRSTVYPSFITLDAPTREFCVAQRAKTSTPLQSLVLMNDPVFVEAARAFAQRVLREGGSDNATRLRYAWRLALARQPADAETAILAHTLEAQLTNYSQNKAAAEALVKVGDLPKPQDLADAELAAWTTVANVLLNLNETISN